MADESAKGKLTLSGKSTLTLKNVGKSSVSEGRKMVQVEVRKKRTISSSPAPAAKVEIDEATAQKLRLIAEAKEHEAKRRQEEEAKEILRQKQRDEQAARLEAEEKQRQEEERLRQEEKAKMEKEAALAAASRPDANKAVSESEEKHF